MTDTLSKPESTERKPRGDLKYIIIFIAAAALCVFRLLEPFNADIINADSSYQYFLTQKDFAEVLRLIPEDYSPPLYGVLLKLWTMAIGNSSLAAMRAFSMLPLWGLLFLAAFPIRKAFGGKASIICTAFFTFSSVNFLLVPETRPTILAYFLFTASAVYCYLAFFCEYRYAYVCFTVFSILTMYTHNIGMLGILALYIICVCMSLARKKFRQTIKFIISGAVCGVVYIPWLLVVLKQFGNVKNHFWSSPDLSLRNIYDWTIGEAFNDGNTMALSNTIIPVALLICIVTLLIPRANRERAKNIRSLKDAGQIIRETGSETVTKALFLILIYVMPIVCFVVFCLVGHPVFVARYFYIFSGVALMNIAAFVSRFSGKGAAAALAAVSAVNCIFTSVTWANNLKKSDFLSMIETLREEEAENGELSFVHAHEWSMGVMMYYFPEAKHYTSDDTWCVVVDYSIYPAECINIGNFSNIGEYETEAYFFEWELETANGRTSTVISKFFDGDGYTIEDLGTFYEPYTYKQYWHLKKVVSSQ